MAQESTALIQGQTYQVTTFMEACDQARAVSAESFKFIPEHSPDWTYDIERYDGAEEGYRVAGRISSTN